MNTSAQVVQSNIAAIPNGSGAAAILSAGIGSLILAVLALAGDKSPAVRNALIFYKPTGPLSGVTTSAIVVWLFTWGILELRWSKKTVSLGRISAVALTLLGLSVLLTFPPIMDLF